MPQKTPKAPPLLTSEEMLQVLTDPVCKNAKPNDKPYRLADEKGMYLEIRSNGAKYWRTKFRHGGTGKGMAFGVYPETGLKEARSQSDDARKQLEQGIDPGAQRKAMKKAQAAETEPFEVVAREWFEKNRAGWVDIHAATVR